MTKTRSDLPFRGVEGRQPGGRRSVYRIRRHRPLAIK